MDGCFFFFCARGCQQGDRTMQKETEETKETKETIESQNPLSYIKLVQVAHQRVVQQVSVHLRLDEDEVDKDDDKVVLDILVAEPAAVATDRQPDVVPAGPVAGTRVLRPERLHRVLALDADGHRERERERERGGWPIGGGGKQLRDAFYPRAPARKGEMGARSSTAHSPSRGQVVDVAGLVAVAGRVSTFDWFC